MKVQLRLSLKILLAFHLVFFLSPGHATTFANRPLGAVVQEAALILRGHARGSHSDWGQGPNQRTIFTYTDFEVTEALKGKPSSNRILLRQPGGAKDDIEMSVPGTASFNPGEDIVVTLAPVDSTDGAYDVLNFTAGKYNVVVENGETLLLNSLGAEEVYDPHSQNAKELSYTSKVSLQTFKKIIEGSAPEAANQKQFQPLQQSVTANTIKSPQAVHPSPMASAIPSAHTDPLSSQSQQSNSPWIIISFFFIFFGSGLGLWWLLGKKGEDHR